MLLTQKTVFGRLSFCIYKQGFVVSQLLGMQNPQWSGQIVHFDWLLPSDVCRATACSIYCCRLLRGLLS